MSAAAMAIAACSSGPSAPQVAHLPGHGGQAKTADQQTGRTGDRDMISFARCMRAHGVQMRDPFHRAGHSGLSIEDPTADGGEPARVQRLHAFPAADYADEERPRGGRRGADDAPLTEYARCMRSHDIGMLDPTPQGQLNLGRVPGITSDFGRYSPQFRAADAACRHFLPASVHDDGTGP